MLETALLAFTTFFATIGPLDTAALFPALTPAEHRTRAARHGAQGLPDRRADPIVLRPVRRAACWRRSASLCPRCGRPAAILLLLIAMDMVFARPSGGTTTTPDERAEAAAKQDVSVFPLATPLIAGPGAIGASILLVAEAQGELVRIAS